MSSGRSIVGEASSIVAVLASPLPRREFLRNRLHCRRRHRAVLIVLTYSLTQGRLPVSQRHDSDATVEETGS